MIEAWGFLYCIVIKYGDTSEQQYLKFPTLDSFK